MKCAMAKFILQLLLPKQKEYHVAVANGLIQTTTNEPYFLRKVIRGHESWLYGYNLEMKAQWSQWKSPGSPFPKMVRQGHSKIKTMLTVFFDWEGVVHHKYTPPGQTINKEYYLNVLCQLEMQYGGNGCNYGQLVIGSFIRQQATPAAQEVCLLQRFFGKTSNHPGDSAFLQPRFGAQ